MRLADALEGDALVGSVLVDDNELVGALANEIGAVDLADVVQAGEKTERLGRARHEFGRATAIGRSLVTRQIEALDGMAQTSCPRESRTTQRFLKAARLTHGNDRHRGLAHRLDGGFKILGRQRVGAQRRWRQPWRSGNRRADHMANGAVNFLRPSETHFQFLRMHVDIQLLPGHVDEEGSHGIPPLFQKLAVAHAQGMQQRTVANEALGNEQERRTWRGRGLLGRCQECPHPDARLFAFRLVKQARPSTSQSRADAFGTIPMRW